MLPCIDKADTARTKHKGRNKFTARPDAGAKASARHGAKREKATDRKEKKILLIQEGGCEHIYIPSEDEDADDNITRRAIETRRRRLAKAMTRRGRVARRAALPRGRPSRRRG